ncbi:MAG: PQQ-binding-like beta-propeller repeat protein [Bacteroidota bacterium]
MKLFLFAVILLSFGFSAHAQGKPFRFAFISDTHIGSPNGGAEEDLRRTVADINQMADIAFVVITGDITELGTDAEIKLAKEILSQLKVPYYIIPGNHDSGWSESGGVSFGKVFGNDKFIFDYNGISFLGCASGPYVRMSDGHIPRDAVVWMDAELKKIDPKKPIIFLNHYPLDKDLDNWYEAIDRLKQHNTLAVLCGHGHNNHALNFEGIPAVMGRSNLRAKAAYGGYNLVDVRTDSILFSERTPGIATKKVWTGIKLEQHNYPSGSKPFYRPSFAVNDSFPNVKARWTYASDANVISTPAVAGGLVIFGNSLGRVDAISLKDGKKQWSYQTGNAIYSSPAVSNNRLVFGSGDGYIYCLSADKGKLLWQFKTLGAVLGCPLIKDDVVYIGGSDHHFRALDLASGNELWNYEGLDGPVVSTPVYANGNIIFGAWDRNLYCVKASNGAPVWQWNNGSTVRNFSPAACIPVIKDDVIYIVAPDRYLTTLDLETGKTLWRTNEATVRESIGISADGRFVYGKTMNDTIVAFRTSREKQAAAWKMDCGFGYEHVPSMLIEKDGQVFFGTKNGRVYAIDPVKQRRLWTFKVDNSMVNTVNVISTKQVIAATMDGKITLLEIKQ